MTTLEKGRQRIYILNDKQLEQLDKNNVDRQLFCNRRTQLNWSITKAIETPRKKKRTTTKAEREIMKANGISQALLSKRLSRGMDKETAINLKPRTYNK